MRKSNYISREKLREMGVEKVIFSDNVPVELVINRGNYKTTVHQCERTCKHKYGKDLTYMYFCIHYNGKYVSIPVADISYMFGHNVDRIPEGYEVDHIDDDSLNNDFNNLQLLTHKDNIRKRKVASNKYIAIEMYGDLL